MQVVCHYRGVWAGGERVGAMGGTVKYESITSDESWSVFDDAARRLLGMDGEDLVQRWESGQLADNKSPELMRVLMLRPSGR
jgi:hypothetical protein